MTYKEKQDRIKFLISELLKYDEAYYNHDNSPISDSEYDKLYLELKELENETKLIFSNSPTQIVGRVVNSKLNKVKHDHLMLSLDKSKNLQDVMTFIKKSKSGGIVFSLKIDGLTCLLTYDKNGDLIRGETRGDGEVGEDITNNCYQIFNIPYRINNTTGETIQVEGEIIVTYDVFEKMNSVLKEDEKFSHPRNYASGSVRQLNTKITRDRNLTFVAWKNVSENTSFRDGLKKLEKLGFTVVPHIFINETKKSINTENLEVLIKYLKGEAKKFNYPIDGIVFTYDDIVFGKSLGNTAHHPLHSFAYKFLEDEYETRLLSIEWNVGKSSQVTPVAIFEDVNINGTKVNRASLSNLTILQETLGLPYIGQKIWVTRRNEVIPKIERAEKDSKVNNLCFLYNPTRCPSCGSILEIKETNNSKALYCPNLFCNAKWIAKLTQFVSKPAMNIEGLSEATLTILYNIGLIQKYKDIYKLKEHKDKICKLPGFGEKSFTNLINSIEKSKKCKLSNYLVALSIPNIGKSAAETIHKYFHGDYNEFIHALENNFDFTQLKDFGEVMNKSLYDWYFNKGGEEFYAEYELVEQLEFIKDDEENSMNSFVANKTFVITGKLSKPRSFYENFIKTNGGNLAGSVSKKTDYLVTNEQSGSSKYNKAVELGIKIINEKEFAEMCELQGEKI